MLNLDEPEWQPLIDLLAGEFMWMYAVELEDGRRLHVYKHRWTRRSLHLTGDGEAFAYVDAERYVKVSPFRLLYMVLATERAYWGPLLEDDD